MVCSEATQALHSKDFAYCISGSFDNDFNLAVRQVFFNHQTKVTANTVFKRTLLKYLGQSLANLPN